MWEFPQKYHPFFGCKGKENTGIPKQAKNKKKAHQTMVIQIYKLPITELY